MSASGFLPPHGHYQRLLSYRKAEIVFDLTYCFCKRFLSKGDRTVDQMIQAARSGKQNIAEGSKASGTSKETELKLTNVARASLEELLVDYQDFLRTRNHALWTKDCKEAAFVRRRGNDPEATYETYREFCETRPAEIVANIAICLLHHANYPLISKSADWSRIFQGGRHSRAHDAGPATAAKQQPLEHFNILCT